VFVLVLVFVFVFVCVCLCDLLLRRLLHGLAVLRLTNLKFSKVKNSHKPEIFKSQSPSIIA
jgi:hypothetical protein